MAINNTEALTILASTPYLGSKTLLRLLEHFGSPLAVLAATSEQIAETQQIPSIDRLNWGWWKQDSSWEKNLELAYRSQVKIIPYTSSEYPESLLQLPDYPPVLYIHGGWSPQDLQGIAVIGTRNSSPYGLAMAEDLASQLSALGYTVISGLARGVDTAAHRGALQRGRTIAVIGSGLSNIYPPENSDLAKQIAEKGAVISAYPMTAPPDRQHFPQRNRLVSGMSRGVLLVESPNKGGAMLTMEMAWKQGKKLFALPGRVETGFDGNHQLLREGKARLVETAKDIDEDFSSFFGLAPTPN